MQLYILCFIGDDDGKQEGWGKVYMSGGNEDGVHDDDDDDGVVDDDDENYELWKLQPKSPLLICWSWIWERARIEID